MSSHSTMCYHSSQSLLPLSSSNHQLVVFSSPTNSLPVHACAKKSFKGVLWMKAKVINEEYNSEVQEEKRFLQASVANDEIRKRVKDIKMMLACDEGEKSISASAYHTAWVALVEDVNGSGSPQFPSCLEWIIQNQLPDGSWGDRHIFLAYDRLLCTLACVIALTHYNVHPDKAHKGLEFFKENIKTLEMENREHMTCGFETIFPSLLQLAKSLNINVPDNFFTLKEVFARRDAKLKRIPMDVLHSVPTSLLFSLESIPGLQWEKLLKVQSKDGSFLFCPSSAAFAFIQSKDQNCLNYLNKVAQNFNGGVPDFYPIDFFEQLWVVDRLERLGISRYFQPEIKEIMNYVYRNWNEKGIGWTKYSDLPDLDDTSMGFRLLRLNGYEVSANVFKNFEIDGKFCCMPGQLDEGATAMLNFFRATQIQFPGEKILDKGKNFSSNILTKKRDANQILDKWIIAKDLPGEVGYALDFPWYASLPRVETRFYLEQYGGGDDVWISKTLYRLHKVSNNTNLELAKLDYNKCQALHCREWKRIQEWYLECGLEELGPSREKLLLTYFMAASSIFEPERSRERLAWVRTSILVKTFTCTYRDQEQRKAFVHEFNNNSTYLNERRWLNTNGSKKGLLGTLIETLHYFSQSSPSVSFHVLHDAWKKWLLGWQREGDKWEGEAELLVKMININGGYELPQELELNPQYQRLVQLTNELCHQLSSIQKNKEHNSNRNYNKSTSGITNTEIGLKMQELVQSILSSNIDIDLNMKKTFLTVTKSFYYGAHCDPTTINSHISKVIFERVI